MQSFQPMLSDQPGFTKLSKSVLRYMYDPVTASLDISCPQFRQKLTFCLNPIMRYHDFYKYVPSFAATFLLFTYRYTVGLG